MNIYQANAKIEILEEALCAILNIAFEESHNSSIDIAINALHGLELDDKYKQHSSNGYKIFLFTLNNKN